jgi:hypothetical protein
MQQLVRCLERQFGPVTLSAEDGYTKLLVRGVALTFPEAERVCLGEASFEDFRSARALAGGCFRDLTIP